MISRRDFAIFACGVGLVYALGALLVLDIKIFFWHAPEKETSLNCDVVDVVYTWVNGSDPNHKRHLREVRKMRGEENEEEEEVR